MAITCTPHNEAKPGDFAKTVLMPGDPLRAKFIAENFLKDPVLVNNVRGIQGYTGLYNNTRVSVMASGMGMPSMAIYSHELFNFYDVENIIRVGSAGGIASNIKVRDIVVGMSACTNSNYEASYKLPGKCAPTASYELLSLCDKVAGELQIPIKIGSFYSTDVFYCDLEDLRRLQSMHNVLATEMEAAVLYLEAARAGKNALAICTVSDCPLTGESLNSAARETTFTDMMKIALGIAENLGN
ncbi:MAG: purine-nucleoside phosphorylase [Ruminococcaceae bacterium]|nr:purine-nucleoside phosphorylase [Oscillospiraceae bacterium]